MYEVLILLLRNKLFCLTDDFVNKMIKEDYIREISIN